MQLSDLLAEMKITDYQIDSKYLVKEKKLGRGTFADVYR